MTKEIVAYIFIALANTRMFKGVVDTDSENLRRIKRLQCWRNFVLSKKVVITVIKVLSG